MPNAALYNQRVAEFNNDGLCTSGCGRKAKQGKTQCDVCSTKRSRLGKVRYNLLKLRRMCTRCAKRAVLAGRVLCTRCGNIYHARAAELRIQLKIEIMTHYCDGQPKCQCCGEDELTFLNIDHVNNYGAKHRKLVVRRGNSIYRWLKMHKYPDGFQVLCFNCNIGRHINGGVCPHQQS